MGKLSKEYNLAVLYPDLAKQWHLTKNKGGPEQYLPKSCKKAWWFEEKDGVFYEWKAKIQNRVSNGAGNPYICGQSVGYGNDLASLRPDLAKQWHPTKNEKGPEQYTIGTHKKVWWLEEIEGVVYEWLSPIYHRVRGDNNPYLSGRAVGYGNDLASLRPDLAKQWHPTKNEKGPECYVPMSSKKVWWCEEAGGVFYEWEAIIHNRVRLEQGNPYLSGHKAGYGNDLATLMPDLARQWHPTKNKKGPEHYTCGSPKKVWWVQEVGGVVYEWQMSIYSRVKLGCNNPYLSGQSVGYGNDLASLCPDLVKQWHPTRNKKGPECYTIGSGKRAWWCEEVGGVFYEWPATIYSRVHGSGNPYICGGPISKISQQWLDFLGVPNNVGTTREFLINVGTKSFRVDGFNPETKTVYEFLGTIWHGDPRVCQSLDRNPFNKRTYGQLYYETLERFDLIRSVGYSIKYVWESDFRAGKKFSVGSFQKEGKYEY